MGKFKEIDLDKDNYVFYKKSTMYFIIVLLIICLIGAIYSSKERNDLNERNVLIEQDRTELMRDVKELQEENKILKSIVENNVDTKVE